MAAIHRRKIQRSEASNGEFEFDAGVKEEEEKVEIPSIGGLTPLAHQARDDGTAQTGAWRQPTMPETNMWTSDGNRARIRSSRVRNGCD